jgi:hypothetical protein
MVLINTRSRLRSDRVEVSSLVQNTIQGVSVIPWAGAFVYSLRECFKAHEHESADDVATIAESAVRDDDAKVALV